jgi:hypothetical protein
MIGKANEAARMEKATEQLREWKDKLEAFNSKVEKPEDKPVEIIQEDDGVIPHIELNGQKKTEDKEIVPDYKDGFDPDEVMFDLPTEEEIDKAKQLEEFKKREEEEKQALEEYARKAKEEEERIKPDLTEVIEPEPEVKEPEEPIKEVKNAKPLVMRTIKPQEETPPKPTLPDPAEMTDDERKNLLDVFHTQNGKYEDITDEELKMERDQSNRAQFLADVSLTKEEAAKQGPITESRMAFFQDIIDDILRGDQTFENVPEENRKIIAQIMDPDIENPQIITKGSALKAEGIDGVEKTTAEGLKEKFMIQPDIEDRPMTDEELDKLLEGFEGGANTVTGRRRMIIKNGKRIFVPVEEKADYVQNEEQSDQTLWQKSKELDIPEPDKNEIILPDLPNTTEDIPEIAESVTIEQSIPQAKFEKYKKRITTEEDYHQRVEARINDLITKLDSKEIKLSDLSKEDQQVIIDILNQNG